jgi:hypothetical protein
MPSYSNNSKKSLLNETKKKMVQKTEKARIFYKKMNLHLHIQEIKVIFFKMGGHTQSHFQ